MIYCKKELARDIENKLIAMNKNSNSCKRDESYFMSL